MGQPSTIAYPRQRDDLELKDVRVALLETVSEIASMERPEDYSPQLVSAAVFLFDDLGVEDQLVAWELFLFRDEEPLFSATIKALGEAVKHADDLRWHEPIEGSAFAKLQEQARSLMRLMETRGRHAFRA